MQQLQTHDANPTVCPGIGSEQEIPSLANSFRKDFATFITTMNCQTKSRDEREPNPPRLHRP